jgi:peptidoglycan hydrolase CwlO-like protein
MVSIIFAIIAFVAVIFNLLQWFLGRSNRNIIEEQKKKLDELNSDFNRLSEQIKSAEKEIEDYKKQVEYYEKQADNLLKENELLLNKVKHWTERPRGEKGKFLRKEQL